MYTHVTFVAKHGVLRVLIISRISTVNQDVRSLLAQAELCKKFVCDRYSGPIEFVVIESQGSGERLDRKELTEAEAHVETGSFDIVIAEDLGRIMRRARVIDYCELCEDYHTRLIAINDNIDTAESKWRRNALWASMKHEECNEDTSDRIKRQMDHNFATNGGCVNHTVWGLIKPPGCKGEAELQWDVHARKLIRAAFWMIERCGKNITEVARWMREHGAVGMSSKKLGRLLRDPIVCGHRRRGMHRTRRINGTGERRGVPAPKDQVKVRFCPHLMIISLSRFERVNRLLAVRNAKYKVGADGVDPRKGRPKRRTTWPGNHLVCDVCGRFFCWGAHGQTDHLVCAGVKAYRCWNTTAVDGDLAAERLSRAIYYEITQLQEFDQALLDDVQQQSEAADKERACALDEATSKRQRLQEQIGRLADSIAETGGSRALREALAQREQQRDRLGDDIQALKRRPIKRVEIPPMDELKRKAREAFDRLIAKSREVPDLIRELAPEIHLVPYRLCGSEYIVLRTVFDLHLAALFVSPKVHPAIDSVLTRRITIDLFDPPQRVAVRTAVNAMLEANPNRTLKSIATELGVTDTAVQRSVALQRAMSTQGLMDEYVLATEPPTKGRQRMHCHPDYRFEPLAQYESIIQRE